MRWRFHVLLTLMAAISLTGCGNLPMPFLGNPGATARRLAVPVTPMLAVAPGPSLKDKAGWDLANLLALSLVKEEVPALARAPRRADWGLLITATRQDDRVTPRYALVDPVGKEQGAIEGTAVSAAAWAASEAALLAHAQQDAMPKVMALLNSVRAARDRADPNSLLNRVARLHVPEVVGAPGDGNQALTRLLRARLTELGSLVQVTPENSDFTVRGDVSVTSPAKGKQRVEIVWTVSRPSGSVTGKVSQLNNVPAGSLDSYWGDVADVVTREAAGGVRDVVERFIGRDAPPPAQPAVQPTTQPAAR